ncbi:hypothetical protein BD779DRAFT_1482610 [Infundibulicybe gibba]|nr:hypothetical protein BD779DRAFT_1482610 [Infundibulicybe gibba]
MVHRMEPVSSGFMHRPGRPVTEPYSDAIGLKDGIPPEDPLQVDLPIPSASYSDRPGQGKDIGLVGGMHKYVGVFMSLPVYYYGVRPDRSGDREIKLVDGMLDVGTQTLNGLHSHDRGRSGVFVIHVQLRKPPLHNMRRVMNAVDAEMIIGLIYDQKSSPNPLRNTVADVRRRGSRDVEGREAEMKRRVWGHKNKQDHERGGRHLDDLGKAVPQPEHVDCSHTANSLQPGKSIVIFVLRRNLELHDQNFELIYRCSESGDH